MSRCASSFRGAVACGGAWATFRFRRGWVGRWLLRRGGGVGKGEGGHEVSAVVVNKVRVESVLREAMGVFVGFIKAEAESGGGGL